MAKTLLTISLVSFAVTLLAYCLPRKVMLRHLRLVSYALGLVVLLASIVLRYVETGILPFATTQQFAAVFAFGAAAFGVGLESRRPESSRAINALSIAVVIALLIWSVLTYRTQSSLVPALQNNPLFLSHVVLAAAAYGTFVVAFAAAVAQLLVRNDGGRARVGPRDMEGIGYQAVRVGFPLFTLAILLGSVWAGVAWGRFWSWDPKETASLVTWLIYAGYLHLRLSRGWSGKKSALVVIVGFLAVVTTFLGNFVFSGLHSYN